MTTLADLIQNGFILDGRKLTELEKLEIAKQIASITQLMHSEKKVNLNFSPANFSIKPVKNSLEVTAEGSFSNKSVEPGKIMSLNVGSMRKNEDNIPPEYRPLKHKKDNETYNISYIDTADIWKMGRLYEKMGLTNFNSLRGSQSMRPDLQVIISDISRRIATIEEVEKRVKLKIEILDISQKLGDIGVEIVDEVKGKGNIDKIKEHMAQGNEILKELDPYLINADPEVKGLANQIKVNPYSLNDKLEFELKFGDEKSKEKISLFLSDDEKALAVDLQNNEGIRKLIEPILAKIKDYHQTLAKEAATKAASRAHEIEALRQAQQAAEREAREEAVRQAAEQQARDEADRRAEAQRQMEAEAQHQAEAVKANRREPIPRMKALLMLCKGAAEDGGRDVKHEFALGELQQKQLSKEFSTERPDGYYEFWQRNLSSQDKMAIALKMIEFVNEMNACGYIINDITPDKFAFKKDEQGHFDVKYIGGSQNVVCYQGTDMLLKREKESWHIVLPDQGFREPTIDASKSSPPELQAPEGNRSLSTQSDIYRLGQTFISMGLPKDMIQDMVNPDPKSRTTTSAKDSFETALKSKAEKKGRKDSDYQAAAKLINEYSPSPAEKEDYELLKALVSEPKVIRGLYQQALSAQNKNNEINLIAYMLEQVQDLSLIEALGASHRTVKQLGLSQFYQQRIELDQKIREAETKLANIHESINDPNFSALRDSIKTLSTTSSIDNGSPVNFKDENDRDYSIVSDSDFEEILKDDRCLTFVRAKVNNFDKEVSEFDGILDRQINYADKLIKLAQDTNPQDWNLNALATKIKSNRVAESELFSKAKSNPSKYIELDALIEKNRKEEQKLKEKHQYKEETSSSLTQLITIPGFIKVAATQVQEFNISYNRRVHENADKIRSLQTNLIRGTVIRLSDAKSKLPAMEKAMNNHQDYLAAQKTARNELEKLKHQYTDLEQREIKLRESMAEHEKALEIDVKGFQAQWKQSKSKPKTPSDTSEQFDKVLQDYKSLIQLYSAVIDAIPSNSKDETVKQLRNEAVTKLDEIEGKVNAYQQQKPNESLILGAINYLSDALSWLTSVATACFPGDRKKQEAVLDKAKDIKGQGDDQKPKISPSSGNKN